MDSSLSKRLSFVLLFAVLSTVNAQKLHVAVYYESLCPDSVRFITNQLYPAYESLKDYIDILFVPFGKSSSFNGGERFQCQHGPNECDGNMIQSCTLNALNGNADASMEYVNCQMQYGAEATGRDSFNGGERFQCQHGPNECDGNMIQSCTLNALNGNADASMEYVNCQMQYGAEATGRDCAAKVGIDYHEVSQCFYGGLGTRLQLGAEKATHVIAYPYPKFVPTIVYNKRFDQYLQNRSLNEFTRVVCEFILNRAPVCRLR